MAVTPMFPLGSVLVPGMPLPLHVFEPRYRALTEHCLARDEPFGVTLIERGVEVGGGDTRFGIGCLARIVDSHRFEDGRFALMAVGTDRVKVAAWLGEDPFPTAETEPWPDADDDVDPALVGPTVTMLRRSLALAAELGVSAAPVTSDLADDPVILGWQVAAGSPLSPLDRLRLLAAEGPGERLRVAHERLQDLLPLLEARLASGGDDPFADGGSVDPM